MEGVGRGRKWEPPGPEGVLIKEGRDLDQSRKGQRCMSDGRLLTGS